MIKFASILPIDLTQKNLSIIKILILTTLIIHLIFYYKVENVKPDIYVVPNVPGKQAIDALSLGDKQFYFRNIALKIQNAGDTFGRFSPLKDYSYEKLYNWFKILDGLDNSSVFVPVLAGFYYINTQNKPDTVHISKYLLEYARYDMPKNWWWMYHSSFIANYYVKDKKTALNIAYELADNYDAEIMPFWIKQLPAFIHNEMGESCEAYFVINDLMENTDKLSPKQQNFMAHFIKNRIKSLETMEKGKFNPNLCKRPNK